MSARFLIIIWCLAGSVWAQTPQPNLDNFEGLALGQESLCLSQATARMAVLGNKMSTALTADMLWGNSAECVCMPKRLRAERRTNYPNWYSESHVRLEQWTEECRVQTFREHASLLCSAYASETPPRLKISICGCIGAKAGLLSNSEARSLMRTYLTAYPQSGAALFGDIQNQCEISVGGVR